MSDLTLDPTEAAESNAQRILRENNSIEMRNSRNYIAAITKRMTNVYAGTVDPVTVQERRAKNKRARKARRHNRNK